MARKSLPLAVTIPRVVLRPFVRCIRGREHLPDGAYILAANHSSLLDGVVLGSETAWAQYRPVHMVSVAGPFRHPLWGWFLKSARCIPLQKASREGSEAMLRQALRFLAMGEGVGILPEGHIGSARRLRRLRPGVALLALESGAPVVPTGIRGSAEVLPLGRRRPRLGRRIEVEYGAPLRFPAACARYHGAPRAERIRLVDAVVEQVGRAMADLCGKEPPPIPRRSSA